MNAQSGGFADVWAQTSTSQLPRDTYPQQQRTDGYDQYDQAQYQARWAQAHHDDRERKLEVACVTVTTVLDPPTLFFFFNSKHDPPTAPRLADG